MSNFAAYWKTIVAVIGGIVAVANEILPIIPAPYHDYVTAVIAFLTALGVYTVPNTTTNPTVAANQSVALKGKHESA